MVKLYFKKRKKSIGEGENNDCAIRYTYLIEKHPISFGCLKMLSNFSNIGYYPRSTCAF